MFIQLFCHMLHIIFSPLSPADKIQLGMLIFTILLFLVAWLPQFIRWHKKPKIRVKLINQVDNLFENSQLWFFRFVLVCHNKDLFLNDFNIHVTYTDGTKQILNKSWTRLTVFTLDYKLRLLIMPLKQNLQYFSILKKDIPIDCYVTGAIENNNKTIEKYEIELISDKDKKYSFTIKIKDINNSNIFFDDSIWRTPTLPEMSIVLSNTNLKDDEKKEILQKLQKQINQESRLSNS